MTTEQRSKTKDALQRYGKRFGRNSADRQAWANAIERTLLYYDERDPIRSKLLRLRYIERHTEEETIDLLHIGRTTYKKAQADLLSTVAVYAAQYGAVM